MSVTVAAPNVDPSKRTASVVVTGDAHEELDPAAATLWVLLGGKRKHKLQMMLISKDPVPNTNGVKYIFHTDVPPLPSNEYTMRVVVRFEQRKKSDPSTYTVP